MDKIISVFQGYIDEAPHFDILYSKKFGYIYVDPAPSAEPAAFLDTPERLIRYLVGGILDVVDGDDIVAATRELMAPYMAQLPEYAPLVEKALEFYKD